MGNKKYYYLKLKENFFESEEMVLLQQMKDGYLYSDILLKMYLRSLKGEGQLMYKNCIPYSVEAIATLTRHQVGTVEKAIETFKALELIEVLDNGAIYMMDIQNFIGQSSTEADRQRAYYNRVKSKKAAVAGREPVAVIEAKPDAEEKPKKETMIQIFERLSPDYAIPDEVSVKMREWFKYKTERKEPYKEQGMKSLLRRVEKQTDKYGPKAVVDLIEECMSNNWKGIIWDIIEKKNENASSKKKGAASGEGMMKRSRSELMSVIEKIENSGNGC